MDLQSVCNNTVELARKVGDFIRKERQEFNVEKITSKGKHDFVTYVDKFSEERLVAGLSEIIPKSGFIAEEGTVSKYHDANYVWIVDPIDGTTNFIHGAPPYSISIGLMYKQEMILGVVYEITLDEAFYAYKGGGAYLNGEAIHVSDTELVAGSLIATGFPYSDYGRLESFMKTMDYFFHNSHGVRRLGSAAADLAYVACGRYDAFYEYNLKAWDVAAGSFIVTMAGGKSADFSNGNNFLFGGEIISTNSRIYDEFSGIVGNIMNDKTDK